MSVHSVDDGWVADFLYVIDFVVGGFRINYVAHALGAFCTQQKRA